MRWPGARRRRGPALAVRRHPGAGCAGTTCCCYAGGVTFYAALASVPGLFVALRVAALLAGRGARPGPRLASLAAALPDELGAPHVAPALVGRGGRPDLVAQRRWSRCSPPRLYGEGLRRAFARLTRGADERFAGWRGRLALLPGPGGRTRPCCCVLLAVDARRSASLFGPGRGGTLLGVVLAFTVDWLLMSAPLVWVFRVVAPDPPSWPAAAVGGVLTASFLAGFLQGFVLFLSLPLDLGAPFGGLSAVGGACAVLLWLWVLHLVVLVGFTLTRECRP